jgi:N-acyl homoserine lactone hydrolase
MNDTMNAPTSITITPVRVADLLAEGERMPVYVHVTTIPMRACWSTPA